MGMLSTRSHISDPGYREIRFRSRDGINLSGWYAGPAGEYCRARGTVILGHGWMSNSLEVRGMAEFLRRECQMNVVGVDFRLHGLSDDFLPTWGLAESWDLEAALDKAAILGLQGPFFLWGGSLGAMAAQLLAQRDARVSGAFLVSPPADALTAIQKVASQITWVLGKLRIPGCAAIGPGRMLIESVYASTKHVAGILSQSDLASSGNWHPEHAPAVFYVMGAEDHFGYSETRSKAKGWYPRCPAWQVDEYEFCAENARQVRDITKRRWFMRASGAGHGNLDWSMVGEYTRAFFQGTAARLDWEYAMEQRLTDCRWLGEKLVSAWESRLPFPVTTVTREPVHRWLFQPAQEAPGWYFIVDEGSGKCMDVCEGRTDNGSQVILYEVNGGQHQMWKPVPTTDEGCFALLNRKSRRCLDLAREDGRPQIWDCWLGNNQSWCLA